MSFHGESPEPAQPQVPSPQLEQIVGPLDGPKRIDPPIYSPQNGKEAQQAAFAARRQRQLAELSPFDATTPREEIEMRADEYYQNRIFENNLTLPSVIAKFSNQPSELCDSSQFFTLLNFLTPNFKWKEIYAWPYHLVYGALTFIELGFERAALAVRIRGYERFSKFLAFLGTAINRIKTIMDSVVHVTVGILPFLGYGTLLLASKISAMIREKSFSAAPNETLANRFSPWRSKISASVKAFLSVIFNLVPILSHTTNNAACYSENFKITFGASYKLTNITGRKNLLVSEASYLIGHCNPSRLMSKGLLATNKLGALSAPADLFRKSITNPSLIGKVYGASTTRANPMADVYCNADITWTDKLSLALPNFGYLDQNGNLDFSMICQSLYTVAFYGPLTLAALGLKIMASVLGVVFHTAFNLMRNSERWPVKLLGGILTLLTLPLLIASHLIHLISNAIEYTRGAIDGLIHLFTSCAQVVALPFSDNSWMNIKNKFKSSALGFITNVLNLIPVAIIVALYFIPFVGPALGTAVSIAAQGSAIGVMMGMALASISSFVLAATAAIKHFFVAPWFARLVEPITIGQLPVERVSTDSSFLRTQTRSQFAIRRLPSLPSTLAKTTLDADAQTDRAAARLAAATAATAATTSAASYVVDDNGSGLGGPRYVSPFQGPNSPALFASSVDEGESVAAVEMVPANLSATLNRQDKTA